MVNLQNLRDALAMLIPLASIFWALSIPPRLGWLVFPEQLLAIILALAIAVVFLDSSNDNTSPLIARINVGLALLALLAGMYLAIRIPVLSEEAFFRPKESLAVAIIIVPLVIEGLRRAVGLSLVVVFALFALYAIAGEMIPGKLQARASTPVELLCFLATDTTAMLGLPLSVTSFVVVMFILFGRTLQTTGGTAFFTGLSQAVAGSGPGSSAKVSVIASSLFGSISGSAVSNVMSTGVLTIPMMKKSGMPAHRAAAIESVASTGGQLMPPIMGAAAFLMAEFLQLPYKDILVAALVPAVLYYLALFLQVDFLSRRFNLGTGSSTTESATVKDVLKSGWLLPIPFCVLIVALFQFNLSPEMAVLVSLVSLVVLSFLRKDKTQRMTPARVLQDLVHTGRAISGLILVTAIAGMIIGILSNTGLSFSLGFVLLGFGENSLFGLLLITAAVCILLGMGLPTTGVYLLLATLAAPPLINLGLEPIQAHLFVLYFGMLSMITPPVALAAFAAASLANAPQMRTGFEAMRMGWCAYLVPFLFVYHPAVLLQGSAIQILVTLSSIVIALLLASAAIAGYARSELNVGIRIALMVLAIPLLLPLPKEWVWLQYLALCVAGFMLLRYWFSTKANKQTSANLNDQETH